MIIRDLLDLVNKEKRRKERASIVKYIVGMVVATTAGIAVGILVAPMSGKETRDALKEKAVDTVEAIKDAVQKKEETAKDPAANAAHQADKDSEDGHEKKENEKKTFR
jgi:gas vesicle protein